MNDTTTTEPELNTLALSVSEYVRAAFSGLVIEPPGLPQFLSLKDIHKTALQNTKL